eukprot:413216_1
MSEIAIKNKYNGKYVVLEIQCPACGTGPISKWVHNKCGYRTEINQYGYVRCKMNHGHPFYNWNWSCHNHHGSYLKADPEYLASSLQCLLKGTASADTLKRMRKYFNSSSYPRTRKKK